MAYECLLISPDAMMQLSSYVHDHFEDSAKPLKVRITQGGQRSLSQNALYWMWLGELVQQVKAKSGESYTTDDLHEYFKHRFCPSRPLTFGKREITVHSTTRLDSGEMTRYLTHVHEWAIGAGFKLTIPIDSEYRELLERQEQ